MPNLFADNIKSLLRDGFKTASGLFSSGGGGSSGIGIGGANIGGFDSGVSHLFRPFAGSAINWSLVTGGIQDNPIAFSCLSIIQENFCQAQIRVEKKTAGEDKYEPVPDHPLLPIFERPNPYYSWDYLTKGVLASMHGQNDAYIGIERDGDSRPAQLYWLPSGVRPDRKKGSKRLIDNWIYRVNDKDVPVPLEDIIHIPMGANPGRPGFGLSGWNALKQDQYILQQTGNYTANVMRNNGALGVFLSPKQIKDENGNITQVKVDPETVVKMWRSKTQGDKVGDAMFMDFPMDVVFPKNSPQDLALDSLPDRSENNICAVFRVSILLVGAYGGRQAKTYANYEEARQSLWEECLLPLGSVIAAELTTQLLPQMLTDATSERIAYDTSQVKALQPDKDEEHNRVREDFKANLIDLYTAEKELDRTPQDEHKGLYFYMLTGGGMTDPNADPNAEPGADPNAQDTQGESGSDLGKLQQISASGRNGTGRVTVGGVG